MAKPKRVVEWDAIGLAYCGGTQSIAEIARKFSVATAGIHTKAKKEGWSRTAINQPGAIVARAKPETRKRGSKYAMRRMIGLVNRLTDELSNSLNQVDDKITPPTEQKFVADMLTSLTRALEKLTALERETREQSKIAGAADANDTSSGTSTDIWNELQRRMAGLAAAGAEGPDLEIAAGGVAASDNLDVAVLGAGGSAGAAG